MCVFVCLCVRMYITFTLTPTYANAPSSSLLPLSTTPPQVSDAFKGKPLLAQQVCVRVCLRVCVAPSLSLTTPYTYTYTYTSSA